jgi:hypothetical protein
MSAINERDADAYLACCTSDVQLYIPLAAFTGPYEGRPEFGGSSGTQRTQSSTSTWSWSA